MVNSATKETTMLASVRARIHWLFCAAITLSACTALTSADADVGVTGEALSVVKVNPKPRITCGGFLGTACPGVGECVDDALDDCDPANGGADCSGVCACTEASACPKGSVFDSSPAVCDCRPKTLGPFDDQCAVILCRAGNTAKWSMAARSASRASSRSK
jgi:hypothetical protein